MFIEFILVSLFAQNANAVGTVLVNKYTTVTACESAAQALRQSASDSVQKRVFACVPFDPGK